MSIWDRIPSGGPDAKSVRKRPKTRSPGPGEQLKLMPLEDAAGWYLTHYLNKRTKPCLGEACQCQKSEKPVATRWQGYLLALEMPKREPVLALLTKNCWDMCEELRRPAVSLRGTQLLLTRRGGSQGIVEATVLQGFYPLSQVPALPYSHRDQLMRVWFGSMVDHMDPEKAFSIEGSAAPLFDDDDDQSEPATGKDGAQ